MMARANGNERAGVSQKKHQVHEPDSFTAQLDIYIFDRRSLDPPTLKQLTGHTLTTHERITLITTIFSDHDHVEMVGSLLRDDAQNVIDAIDEVNTCTF
jgi:hypothetical protein